MIRDEIERVLSRRAPARIGRVVSYDEENHRVKVRLEPWVPGDEEEDENGMESGWIPIASMWAGPGWGLFSPPLIGSQVELHFVNGNYNAPFAVGRFWDASHPPLSGVKQGELVARHESGSQFKFHENGDVSLHVEGDLALTATGSIASSATGGWQHQGDITVDGEVTAGSVALSDHTHSGVQPGGGNTGGPS
jgi:phage baseplate assembly protein gpV